MIRSICLLIISIFAHCLQAQQTMRKNTRMKETRQEMRDTMQEKNGKRKIVCPICKGKAFIEQNTIVSFEKAKEKKTCSFCGVKYWNNVRHFHVSCSDCRGKGYFLIESKKKDAINDRDRGS